MGAGCHGQPADRGDEHPSLSGIDTGLFALVFGFIPNDFGGGIELAQNAIEGAQFDFSTAAADFAGNNVADGLLSATDGFNELAVYVPGDLLLGLTASLVSAAPDVGFNSLADALLAFRTTTNRLLGDLVAT